MPNYFFSVHSKVCKEDLGAMALKSDARAVAFAKLVISDLMREDSGEYAGWVMDIYQSKRLVGAISCDP
jgi:hypothetical protein